MIYLYILITICINKILFMNYSTSPNKIPNKIVIVDSCFFFAIFKIINCKYFDYLHQKLQSTLNFFFFKFFCLRKYNENLNI